MRKLESNITFIVSQLLLVFVLKLRHTDTSNHGNNDGKSLSTNTTMIAMLQIRIGIMTYYFLMATVHSVSTIKGRLMDK